MSDKKVTTTDLIRLGRSLLAQWRCLSILLNEQVIAHRKADDGLFVHFNAVEFAAAEFERALPDSAYNGRTAQLAAVEGDTAETEESDG